MPSRLASIFVTLLLGILATALPASAQVPAATLTGTVVDAETGEPLPGASVFIARSLIGTTSGRDGSFVLRGVPIGAHRLYVSFVGYESAARDLLLREPRVYTFAFELGPAVVELEGDVIVEGERDDRWARRLANFTERFIGETPNASETKIMNPEVLSFDGSGVQGLKATVSEPLIIENRALGYRITYFLREFSATGGRTSYDGEPLFEEMTPADAIEAARWNENRRRAFVGSLRHFMLAALAGKLEPQGFQVFMRSETATGEIGDRRTPLDPSGLLRAGEVATEKVLQIDNGFLEVIFTGELEDRAYRDWLGTRDGMGAITLPRDRYQTSWLRTENGPTVVDYKGDFADPYGVTQYGYLAFERVADEVPKEYRPR